MVKRGYDKSLAAGTVCAGGTLGILIPPSIMLVVYGPMAGISVGKLFMAAFIPGFLLSGLYITYIAIRCYLQPEIGPAVPAEERAVPFWKKTSMLASSLIPPAFLILAVLGAIFFGIAPPTEAAAVGAFAATLLTIAYRKFSFNTLKQTALETLKVTSMILLIGGMSFAYVGVFVPAGGAKVVEAVILSAPGGHWGAFAMIMFIIFVLGFFIDWIGIIFIMVPILAPIAPALGFDPLWFGMMIMINLQSAFMTPPMAAAIFYLRGAAAPELGVTMGDIIRGVTPFVMLIIVGLGLCVAFPQIILWLPSVMIK
jgi:tripartite ATP-independent transporter DctM subunit